MTCTAQEIADAVGGDLEGDGRVVLSGIAGVREARPGDLTFVANPRYATDLASTRAGAALVARDWSKPAPCVLIRVDNPDHSFAQAAERFAPAPVQPQPGIHPSAVIAPDAVLGADVCIGPCCVLESGCRIGDRTVLFAGVYVGHQSAIGADGHIYPHVSIRERCRIGNRVILHNGVVLGSDGFGYSVDEKGVRHKIPQIGSVEIGDDVEIGANTTVDRARFGRTVIGNGVKIDNLVQIAHNVTVGDHSVIVSQSGVSGSTAIGSRCVLAGQTGVVGHIVIGDGVIVGARGVVTKNIPAGSFVSGFPAAPHEKTMKIQALTLRLPEWKDKLSDLETRLDRLEKAGRDRTSGT